MSALEIWHQARRIERYNGTSDLVDTTDRLLSYVEISAASQSLPFIRSFIIGVHRLRRWKWQLWSRHDFSSRSGFQPLFQPSVRGSPGRVIHLHASDRGLDRSDECTDHDLAHRTTPGCDGDSGQCDACGRKQYDVPRIDRDLGSDCGIEVDYSHGHSADNTNDPAPIHLASHGIGASGSAASAGTDLLHSDGRTAGEHRL